MNMLKFRRFTHLTLAALFPLAGFANAPAQSNEELDEVIVSAMTGDYTSEALGTAAQMAPTRASLSATQPQSIITRDFIEKAVAPTAEYSRVVTIAPSLSGDSTNGPGLSETKVTMRGFSDDQYNVTFDGIPWGDTNNPAHHSTSFFPASVIGSAIVERGPGNASNLGYATFGGSINLFSKKPSEKGSFNAFGSVGTWNTRLYGAALESGSIGSSGASVMLNVQNLSSDGYVRNNSIDSTNYTAKAVVPVGNTVLTLLASQNKIKYVQPDNSSGPTLAQSAAFGKDFGLNDDPTSFNYVGFNHTDKDTDFEYVRFQTEWGNDWSTDVRAYTYAYNNQTISSSDPTGATALGAYPVLNGAKVTTDVPGIDKQNKYRVNGGIADLQKKTQYGIFRSGVWYEKSDTDRHQYNLDLTKMVPNYTKTTTDPTFSIKFDQQSNIYSTQPYVEFEAKPTDSLTVTPGFKQVKITRDLSASVNQTTRTPANFSVDYTKSLPFMTVNQRIGKEMSVYAQYAQGFQIPDLKTLYIADPSHNSTDPQTSTNYQLGVVGKNDKLTWDADIYRIDFKNKYVSNGKTGTDAAYINVGGAKYQGVEGQVTYMVANGLAVYSNGSLNQAEALDTGKQISGAPKYTAGLGLLWDNGPWATSIIYKRTGDTYQQEYSVNPATYETYKIGARDNTDFSLSYTFADMGFEKLKLQLNVFNLMSKQDVTSISPASNVVYDQYQYQAPRSVQLSLNAKY